MESRRFGTDEIVQKAWENAVHREVGRGRDFGELPEQCPPNVRMILEAVDEIAQWRADEAMRSYAHARGGAVRPKRPAAPKTAPKPRPKDSPPPKTVGNPAAQKKVKVALMDDVEIVEAHGEAEPVLWAKDVWMIDKVEMRDRRILAVVLCDPTRRRAPRRLLRDAFKRMQFYDKKRRRL